ncbi:MAG: hypothetical protein IPK52_26505 [Chloroflexi bacterium]|nr:hypothetical protein [Chloroflexota bacterium]
MADSLFDSRWRYDFIYPRGRSGETLRAVDTQNNDRPVVIKRPAPSDAPPIRAAQEVSIATERRVLSRLAGHPVLTELVAEGQFSVGGLAHQYIVVERAEGVIVADEVLKLSESGERLPELEMLVVLDRLLDLLYSAHSKDIVYNDVDAKHLFWNRETYRLKVIDWGNAVFMQGDDVTATGISKQSDIYQVGELMYFILTGGGRPEVPRDAPDEWSPDFKEDNERIQPRLRMIVARALHPRPARRYQYLVELQRALTEYRLPFERERDGLLSRSRDRLKNNLSKNDLMALSMTLQTAMSMDPGFPAVLQIQNEIESRLQALDLAAGLDAARIYLEGGNYPKAIELFSELVTRAKDDWLTRINVLMDACRILNELASGRPPGPGIADGVSLLLDGKFAAAGYLLVAADSEDAASRKAQWLVAERVSAHVPEVQLLRPNLYRLELALAALGSTGVNVTEARRVLVEVRGTLDEMVEASLIADLRDRFREIVDRLTALQAPLTTLMVKNSLSDTQLPLSALDRATNAAMALADNMHVVGRQAVTSPVDAREALQLSRAIDPTNPAWDSLDELLGGLYRRLQTYQTFTPTPDGADIDAWLHETQADLMPYEQTIFDDTLSSMIAGLSAAQQAWQMFAAASITGDRAEAVQALSQAIDNVSMLSPTLSGWLGHLRSVIENTRYVERHALYGGLGRTLADGWEAFDKGRLVDAERLGEDSLQIAHEDRERRVATRLRNLSRLAREWVERGGAASAARSQTALDALAKEYTAEETRIRKDFDAQMPSHDTYLKAMGRGVIELYARNSTAATRVLGFDYLLHATLEAHTGHFADYEFYREASMRALGEVGPRHPLTRSLDEFVERRRELNRLSAELNRISGPDAINQIERVRRAVDDSPLGKSLGVVTTSLRDVEAALRDWGDGEFRVAGGRIENAIKGLQEAETQHGVSARAYRAWLENLIRGAAELTVQMKGMRQTLDKMPDMPSDTVRDAHQKIVELSNKLVGELSAAKLIQWRDTYERFLQVYTDTRIRRSTKMERLNELFRAMFIDRHPAYPLYRHWYTVTENAPEFPAPPTSEPVPTLREEEDLILTPSVMPPIEMEDGPPSRRPARVTVTPQTDATERSAGRGRRWLALIALALLIVAIAAVFILTRPKSDSTQGDGLNLPGIALTISATLEPSITPSETPSLTPTGDMTQVVPTVVIGDNIIPASNTETPVPEAATETPVPTLTETLLPSETPTITPSPTVTLPPQGLQGEQDLLAMIARIDPSARAWTTEQFSEGPDETGWRLGIGAQSTGGTIQIPILADILDAAYGNQAATRIRRVDAQISLSTFDPLLSADQVYFGIMLIPADGSPPVGLKVEAQTTTQIALYQRRDNADSFVSQRAVNFISGRLRIIRDTNTQTVAVFYNEEQIGPSIPFVGAEVPVTPVLFVRDGGVVTVVNNWRITLR